MTTGSTLRGVLAAFVAVLAFSPAHAAEPASMSEVGRYQLLSGTATLGAKEVPVIVMIDTEYGRVWILNRDIKSGIHMKQLPLERLDLPPTGMLGRPLPVVSKPDVITKPKN